VRSFWKGEGDYGGKDLCKNKFWVWSGTEGVMHRERGVGDDDDDESVRERWDDSDRDSSSTGWRSSLGSSFQRRGEAWQKERLLTFKYIWWTSKGGNIRKTSTTVLTVGLTTYVVTFTVRLNCGSRGKISEEVASGGMSGSHAEQHQQHSGPSHIARRVDANLMDHQPVFYGSERFMCGVT